MVSQSSFPGACASPGSDSQAEGTARRSWGRGSYRVPQGPQIRLARTTLLFGALVSDPDDVNEFVEVGEVVGIPGVERQTVGMGSRSDQQVGDSTSM